MESIPDADTFEEYLRFIIDSTSRRTMPGTYSRTYVTEQPFSRALQGRRFYHDDDLSKLNEDDQNLVRGLLEIPGMVYVRFCRRNPYAFVFVAAMTSGPESTLLDVLSILFFVSGSTALAVACTGDFAAHDSGIVALATDSPGSHPQGYVAVSRELLNERLGVDSEE